MHFEISSIFDKDILLCKLHPFKVEFLNKSILLLRIFFPPTCILSNTNLSLIVKNPQHIGTNTQCT